MVEELVEEGVQELGRGGDGGEVEQVVEEGVQELGRGGDGGEVEEAGGGDSRTWKDFR